MRRVRAGLILALMASSAAFLARADEPAASETVISDVDGKEYKLTAVKFGQGTKRLGWMADPQGKTEDAKKGPLALEVRELTSAMSLAQGVVTLVPVTSLEAVKYDFERELVNVHVKGLTQPLTGVLNYPRINVFGLSGSSDGKPATFTGGIRGKPHVKSVTFGDPQPRPRAKEGILWNIQILKTQNDQPKVDTPTLTARNLKVLYSYPGNVEQLVDALPTRKGAAITFDDKLKRFELIANDVNTNFAAAEVEPTEGAERVVAIPLTVGADKKVGTLVGLLGEVDAGWKLFPMHTIRVIKPSTRKIE